MTALGTAVVVVVLLAVFGIGMVGGWILRGRLDPGRWEP